MNVMQRSALMVSLSKLQEQTHRCDVFVQCMQATEEAPCVKPYAETIGKLSDFQNEMKPCLSVGLALNLVILLVSGFRLFIGGNILSSRPLGNPCDGILNVVSEKSRVRILFSRKVSELDPSELCSYFGYNTSVYDIEMMAPPGSCQNASFINGYLEFDFPLPFITEYSGSLFCIDKSKYREAPFHVADATGIVSQFNINISVPQFRTDFAFSQIKCYGDTPEERWCEARKIGSTNWNIIFYTPVHFVVDKPLLYFGTDNSTAALYNPAMTEMNYATEHQAGQYEVTFICNPRIDDYSSLIYDFLLPAFRILKAAHFPKSYRFATYSSIPLKREDLVFAVTQSFPIPVQLGPGRSFYEHAVLGLLRSEKPDLYSGGSIIDPVYYTNPSEIAAFRKTILKSYNIEVEKQSSVRVVFMQGKNRENITNADEIVSLIKNSCSLCSVDVIAPHNLGSREIVKIMANTDVLIGRPHPRLDDMIWMKSSSHVIEIRPYNFTCQNRYKEMAEMSGLKYHMVMNRVKHEVIKKRKDLIPLQQFCLKQENCRNTTCTEFLNDEKLEIEIDTFKEAWEQVISCYVKN